MIYMTDKELFNELSYKRKNVYENLSEQEYKEMFELCDEYREFLDEGKTERECVEKSIKMAELHGFKNINSVKQLKAGDKVYKINRNKNILLAVIGSEDIKNGVNLVGAHIDSPRLDLKQNPLYESNDMALLKTHYYGGIKKYQWTAIPLAMHGVIFTKEGKKVTLNIGENENDPVFCVTDLLPHLAKDQMTKKMIDGLDESFVGAYGQDDRVCAFTTLKGIFAVQNPKKTALAILVDKEEIGSTGNTGMLSAFFEMTLAEIIEKINGNCTITDYNTTIENSACLSSDVGAAVDPNYESVYEKRNAAFAGCGMVLMKYTGARGKSESSDASAEFVYEIGKILDDNGVIWQTSELGKVDQGGGGTIAQYVANLNMDVIDCGVPVLSMHAPFEVTAKSDVYMAYKSYVAFYNNR